MTKKTATERLLEGFLKPPENTPKTEKPLPRAAQAFLDSIQTQTPNERQRDPCV